LLPSQTVFMFSGCLPNYKLQEIKEALIEICKKTEIKCKNLDEKGKCCGFPLLSAGLNEHVEQLANYNVEKIRKLGVEKIITPCPGCYEAFRIHYPDVVGNLGFRIEHHSEFIYELIKSGKLKFIERDPNEVSKVVYHDPCHLVVMGIFDAPRKILESVPEIKLMEFSRNKEESRCCGGGSGVVWNAHPKLSLSMAEDRVKEALSLGADSIATACPLCVNCLDLASRRLRARVPIADIGSFLLKWLR